VIDRRRKFDAIDHNTAFAVLIVVSVIHSIIGTLLEVVSEWNWLLSASLLSILRELNSSFQLPTPPSSTQLSNV
jgi:hypothetical protein